MTGRENSHWRKVGYLVKMTVGVVCYLHGISCILWLPRTVALWGTGLGSSLCSSAQVFN